MEKILEVQNIEKYYGTKANISKAIDNISFEVEKGEFLGIMGASGSRKNNLTKLYIYNRQSHIRTYNSKQRRHYKIKRKQTKQIQERRTRFYISRL